MSPYKNLIKIDMNNQGKVKGGFNMISHCAHRAYNKLRYNITNIKDI
jgi:hypothetical protein